jgi:hypothetical protein
VHSRHVIGAEDIATQIAGHPDRDDRRYDMSSYRADARTGPEPG